MSSDNNAKSVAVKVSLVGMVANIALTTFKFIAGFIANSSAMVSDAVHSASDVFGGLIVIIGVRFSNKESDSDHPYGHERFECVAALILSAALFLTGGAIGFGALEKIFTGAYKELEIKGQLALIAAITSIVVKEAMFWYTRINAKRIDSENPRSVIRTERRTAGPQSAGELRTDAEEMERRLCAGESFG